MTFKPKQATWFETYTPREQTVYAIEALARTGTVELYHDIWSAKHKDIELIRSRLNEFNKLANKFADDLPSEIRPPKRQEESPERLAESSLKTLRKWSAELLWLKREIQKTSAEQEQLKLIKELLEATPGQDLNFSWFDHASGVLYKKLFYCPSGEFTPPSGQDLVVKVFPAAEKDFVLALGTPDHAEIIEAAATLTDCVEINIPAWLANNPLQDKSEISERIDVLEQTLEHTRSRLAAHKDDSTVKAALASMRLLDWFLENLCISSHENNLCHIVGWTSAESADDLQAALKQADIEAIVLFSDKPAEDSRPVHSHHSKITQPFSFFVDLAGTPGSEEIDPTPLLAVIVPLLFGYMFPDVGHGLILVLAGILAGKRIPAAQILIPCGLGAAAFGFIFGDVFGQHDIIEPLWLKPLENPMLVLLIPLVMGALLIATGLVFSGIEAYWRKELGKWFLTDASVLVLYFVLISGLFMPSVFWLLLPVLAWYVAGTLLTCSNNRLSCSIYGLGNLLESVLRLGMNSISFVRVGAFALAHSGTSHAANLIAGMIDNSFGLVIFMLLSHVFIITLEGLIVFVQTSRLILFEFFIRFLKADGRVFKPIQSPTN